MKKDEEIHKNRSDNNSFFSEDLSKNKRWINTLLQASIDAFWIMNTKGYILEVNQAMVDILGYSRKELINMKIEDLEIKGHINACINKVIENDKYIFEGKYRAKDERSRYLEVSASILEKIEDNGEFILVAFARDITEQKKQEEKLKETHRENQEFLEKLRRQNNRINTILRTSMDAFWVMDFEGEILEVNESFIDLFGYSLIETLSMNINDLDINKEKEEIKEHLQDVKKEGQDRFETKYRCKDGEVIDLEMSVTFVDSLEEPMFEVFARDITQRKEKQRELEKAYQENQDFLDKLRKQNNRINTILYTSMDAFWVMDTKGYILETNQAFIDLFEYSLIEVMNMNINDLDITNNKEEIQEHINTIKEKGKDKFETKYRCKDDRIVDLEISATFVDILDEPIFVVFARDMTERNRKKNELERTQKQLVRSEKMAALGRLVAGVAHEINTPVGIGVTAASHLGERTKKLTKLYQDNKMKRSNLEKYLKATWESTQMILKNLDNASELISNFKQVAVDQTNNQKRKFKVKDYLEDIMLSLSPKLKKTKHQVKINCDDDLIVDTYPGPLSQVVTNLIMNSLLHGFDNIEQGKINIEVLEENEMVKLKYNDNGKGISKEDREKIFEPFFTTRRGQGGTGLGLNLVYNLVTTSLRGKIKCKSTVGEGTTFMIDIPKEVEGNG